jgi:hypothetical protein
VVAGEDVVAIAHTGIRGNNTERVASDCHRRAEVKDIREDRQQKQPMACSQILTKELLNVIESETKGMDMSDER